MRSTLLSEWLQAIGMLHFADDGLDELAELSEEELQSLTDLDDDEREELAKLVGDGDEDDDDDEDGEKPPNVAKLKEALAKERKARKEFERKFKAKERAETKAKNKSDDELTATKDENTTLQEQNGKLATKLRDQAVDQEIVKIATKLNFRDADDALSLVKRADIEVDQDEDDPSEVEVDEDSVLTAVQALAKKKPHLLIADGDESPSGSKFSGGKGKKKTEASEEALRKKYKALSR